MNCRCGKKAVYNPDYNEFAYCEGCFLKMVEKRVKKDFRKKSSVEIPGPLYLYDDGSKEFKAAEKLLDRVFFHKMEIKPTKDSSKKPLAVPYNAETYIEENMKKVFVGKMITDDLKGVPVMQNLPEEEVLLLCKIFEVEGEKQEHSDIMEFFEKIEERHPQTKFSLLKAIEFLEERIQKK